MTDDGSSGRTLLTPKGVTVGSACVNLLMGGVKVVAGVAFSSQVILVDGLHSVSDLVTDLVVLAGLRISDRPPDDSHHYGHRRVGTLVAMFVGGLLGVAALWIGYNALRSIHNYLHHGAVRELKAHLPFCIALASVPIKEVIFQLTRRVGKRTSNLSLIANAWHHRTDALAGLVAAAALGGVLVGGEEWRYLDPLGALVLCAFLLVVGWKIIRTSASELVDRAPDPELLAAITEVVENTPGVRTHHAFRARQVGGKIAMDVHVQVDPALSVREGHDIASQVRRRIVETSPGVLEVIVHVEPSEEQSE